MSTRLKRLITGDPAKGVGIAVAAGVFLALTNAFGSTTGLGLRLAYWVVLMIVAGLWAEFCMRTIRRLPGMERSWLIRFVVSVLVIGLPLTVVVWGVTGWIFYGQAYGPDMFPGLVWRVLLITAVMTAIGWMNKHSIAWASAGHIPAYKPVAESEEFKAMEPNATYSSLADNASFDPRSQIAGVASPTYDAAINIIAPAIHGYMSPEEAVQQIKDELTRALN